MSNSITPRLTPAPSTTPRPPSFTRRAFNWFLSRTGQRSPTPSSSVGTLGAHRTSVIRVPTPVIAETAFGAEEEEEERESPYAKLLPPTEDQKARFEAVMADIHQRDGIKKTERAFTSAKEKNPPTPPPRNLPIRKRSVDLPLPPTPRDESGHFYESIRSTPPETLVSLQQPSAKRLKESPEENKPSLQPQKDPLFHHNEERSPFTPTRSMSRTSKMQSIFPPTPPDEQMSVKKQLDFNPQFNDLDARTLNALEESDIKLGKEASESLT